MAELETVLSSNAFAKSPSLTRFLSFVCERYFAGESDQLKEYNIAVEAYGRAADFNPEVDSLVRVDAYRVRKRLAQYYEREGAEHELRIVIPVGRYAPEFRSAAQPADFPGETAPAGQETSRSRRLRKLAIAGAAALLVALAVVHYWPQRSSTTRSRKGASPFLASAPMHEGHEIRILCGSTAGEVVDALGKLWRADRYFSGGRAVEIPTRTIVRAADPVYFTHRREGVFSYRIPLSPATYEVRLYFAETGSSPENTWRFQVRINGKPALPEFDVIVDAGAANTADVKSFSGVSPGPDGILRIDFVQLTSTSPFLNAIEILPSPDGRPQPWRMVARRSPYVDPSGQRWDPDYLAEGGRIVFRKGTVTGAADPGLFEGERYGSFNYVIPAACECCAVKLHFAETYFGAPSVEGGAGSRIFDVYSNERTLLKDFDIYSAAGGANRAVERLFTGLRPDPLGKITLRFVPVKNYASVNAIELSSCDAGATAPKTAASSR
jgi:hypothetical protein